MKNNGEFKLRECSSEEIRNIINNVELCSDERELNELIGSLKFAINSFIRKVEDTIEKQDNEISRLGRLNEMLEEEYRELEEDLYKNQYCVIGDYDELKRQMEMNGFWSDELEYWMENFCRFHNSIV
jgi:chaperonin cofactor prefoldin